MLRWYDENYNDWHLDELEVMRKVSSLSGISRVLDNLSIEDIPELMKDAMNRTNIFNVASLGPVDHEDTSFGRLNESQNTAVLAVNSSIFKDGFLCVQGPPGTGKSTTLVEMICATGQNVIASAPSNAATANIALKLFETSKFHHLDICVYGNNCDDSVHFLNPVLRKETYVKFLDKYSDEDNEERANQMLRDFC
eukprot:15326776-Ditylum_brightwellii.AAC.1